MRLDQLSVLQRPANPDKKLGRPEVKNTERDDQNFDS